MRLKGYLTEESEPEDILDTLKKDCKPYLKASKYFHRRTVGIQKHKLVYDAGIIRIKPRKDRKPKDTLKLLHQLADNWFLKEFGWKARSEGVFTVPLTSKSDLLAFPIGKFKFIYSQKVYDMFVTLSNYSEKKYNKFLDRLTEQEINDIWDWFIEKYGKSYFDMSLNSVTIGNEVMFQCKEYYLVKGEILREFQIKTPKEILSI